MPKTICKPEDKVCLETVRLQRKRMVTKSLAIALIIPMAIATIIYTASYTGTVTSTIDTTLLTFELDADAIALGGTPTVLIEPSDGSFIINGMNLPAYTLTSFNFLIITNTGMTDLFVTITIGGTDVDKVDLFDAIGGDPLTPLSEPAIISILVGASYTIGCNVDLRTSGLIIGGTVEFTLQFDAVSA